MMMQRRMSLHVIPAGALPTGPRFARPEGQLRGAESQDDRN
jgi:hypothetical protein